MFSDAQGRTSLAKSGLLAIALATLVHLLGHGWALFDPFVVNDDTRQQLFWMQAWMDPDLYPDYPLFDYARQYVPWGVQAIYFLGSMFSGPLFFSKILATILYAATGSALFLIGRELHGNRAGWCVFAAFVLMPAFPYNIAGGLARAFAAPTLALFLLARVRCSSRLTGFALLVQALCIPYIFLLCAGGLGLEILHEWWKQKTFTRSTLLHGVFLVLGALLVLAWRASYGSSDFGPIATGDLLRLPEYGPDGRFHLLPSPLWDFIINPLQSLGLFREAGLYGGILSLAALLPILLLGAVKAPRQASGKLLAPLAYLVAASLVLYAAAHLLALRLFVPGRYVEYTINLLLSLALGGGFLVLAERMQQRKNAGILLLIAFSLLGAYRLSLVGLYDYSEHAPLYGALEDTPKNALMAGHPALMDNVLTFGKRKVLASSELAHPWSLGLWARLKPALTDTFKAYYANDKEEVLRFCRQYGITHLVVDDRHYTSEFIAGRPFFAPFDDLIRNLTARGKDYILLQPEVFPEIRTGPHTRILLMSEATKEN